jgi:hypothetical protein
MDSRSAGTLDQELRKAVHLPEDFDQQSRLSGSSTPHIYLCSWSAELLEVIKSILTSTYGTAIAGKLACSFLPSASQIPILFLEPTPRQFACLRHCPATRLFAPCSCETGRQDRKRTFVWDFSWSVGAFVPNPVVNGHQPHLLDFSHICHLLRRKLFRNFVACSALVWCEGQR